MQNHYLLGKLFWRLLDIDGDGLGEIIARNINNFERFVFKLQGSKVITRQGKVLGGLHLIVRQGQIYLVTFEARPKWLFPPHIRIEGRKLQWIWKVGGMVSIFWELPKGKDALSPSKWRKHEAPFELVFAADIDGDGSDELIGRDTRGRHSLYWFRKTKSGELQWQSTLLCGRQLIFDWALVKSGNRRGLCIAWDNGTVELLTMRKR